MYPFAGSRSSPEPGIPFVTSRRADRIEKLSDLAVLGSVVVECERCPRLRAHCRRVARERKREFQEWEYWGRPVPGFGDPRARLLVVGLAPAAHGGNRTGRVFTGDSSGDWLYEALHRFGFASQPTSVSRDDGLELTDCYVAAAARCAPPKNKPTPREFANCRPYLEAEIRLLRRVRVVLVLGRMAFENFLEAAACLDGPRPLPAPRFAHGAEATLPDGRILICSFHPSRRNTNTGLLTRPMWHGIFRRARELVGSAPARIRHSRAAATAVE
jgi:uracil-DNA glycosylase